MTCQKWCLFLVKPSLDRLVAALALLVLSPVLMGLALVVRAKLGSPIFFRQQRPGLRGRPFNILKFRTMTDDLDTQRMRSLVMLLNIAHLMAVIVGILVVKAGRRAQLDWYGERRLSFLQLRLREIARQCYQRLALPTLTPLPRRSPPKAYAMKHFQQYRELLIEFSKVLRFS
jgi:hypothetical protein